MEAAQKILPIIVFFFLIATTIGCIQTTQPPAGDDFTFTTVTGETKRLSDYHGGPVLLDFMGVACEPCQRQMIVLYQISRTYPNLTIISIDVWTTQGETAQNIQQLKDAFQQQNMTLGWTFALDDAQGSLGRRYASDGVPHLYLYTKQGNLYYSHLGYEEYSALAAKVDAVVS